MPSGVLGFFEAGSSPAAARCCLGSRISTSPLLAAAVPISVNGIGGNAGIGKAAAAAPISMKGIGGRAGIGGASACGCNGRMASATAKASVASKDLIIPSGFALLSIGL